MKLPSKEDAESNARLVNALFEDAEVPSGLIKDHNIPSHMQLDLDEEGNPKLMRFAYVDEQECIGCTYCSQVARNTFFMEEEAGRARVFAQGDDDPETVMEAIDCCPVNCISFVDYEDLVTLETERDGMVIDQRSAGMRHGDSFAAARQGITKAKLGGSVMCCNNCPSRGCKECPMYGVGLNPVYIARLEEREAKREASGEAQREATENERAAKVDTIFDGADDVDAAPAVGLFSRFTSGVVKPAAPPAPAVTAAEQGASASAEDCIVDSESAAELVECASEDPAVSYTHLTLPTILLV